MSYKPCIAERSCRRVSILHGRPASVSHNDVDADSMEDLADFRSSGGPSKYQNMCAMVDLTARLADISHTMYGEVEIMNTKQIRD